jgi:hypothetical protein
LRAAFDDEEGAESEEKEEDNDMSDSDDEAGGGLNLSHDKKRKDKVGKNLDRNKANHFRARLQQLGEAGWEHINNDYKFQEMLRYIYRNPISRNSISRNDFGKVLTQQEGYSRV